MCASAHGEVEMQTSFVKELIYLLGSLVHLKRVQSFTVSCTETLCRQVIHARTLTSSSNLELTKDIGLKQINYHSV